MENAEREGGPERQEQGQTLLDGGLGDCEEMGALYASGRWGRGPPVSVSDSQWEKGPVRKGKKIESKLKLFKSSIRC